MHISRCHWGCLSLWVRLCLFLDSSSSGICVGQLDWQKSLLAPHLPAFTVVVPFQTGGTHSYRVKGESMGSWPLLPLCLPPCHGKLRAPSQAVHSERRPLGSLGSWGGPTMPLLPLRKASSIPPLWLLEREEEERAKKGMKTKAGGCSLWEERLARVNAKGCWLVVAPHALTDSF